MAEHSSEEFWLDLDFVDFVDDIVVQSKRKNRPRKTKKEIEKISFGNDDNKTIAFARLLELAIPKSAQTLLTKLISNGQLTSVNRVWFQKRKSIILSGKVNQTHRNFPLLTSDDVIIKILINGNKSELWKRADDECYQQKPFKDSVKRPTFLLQTGNIIIMSMIGRDGKPAPTLKHVLKLNRKNIAMIYSEIVQFWCTVRDVTFDPSNILYEDGKWWIVGYGGHANNTTYVSSSHHLLFYRTNLNHLIDFFCHYGLTIKQAEYGFMKYGRKYYWYTQEVMRGMTRKRSFFSIMYMN